jgi:hypothetical protein
MSVSLNAHYKLPHRRSFDDNLRFSRKTVDSSNRSHCVNFRGLREPDQHIGICIGSRNFGFEPI